MRDGWIKLWRKLLANPWLQDPIQLSVFVRVLLAAETSPTDRSYAKGIIKLNRGEALVSEVGLAKTLGVGRQRVRRAIINLEKGGIFFNHKTNHIAKVITVCNFEHYQAYAPLDQPQTQPPANHKPTTSKESKNLTLSPSLPFESESTPHATHVPPKGGNGHGAYRGTRLDKDWEPGDDGVEYARKLGMSDDAINETYHDFMRHWLAKAGAAARKVDWGLTWQTWVRRANERFREKAAREEAWRQRYQTQRH